MQPYHDLPRFAATTHESLNHFIPASSPIALAALSQAAFEEHRLEDERVCSSFSGEMLLSTLERAPSDKAISDLAFQIIKTNHFDPYCVEFVIEKLKKEIGLKTNLTQSQDILHKSEPSLRFGNWCSEPSLTPETLERKPLKILSYLLTFLIFTLENHDDLDLNFFEMVKSLKPILKKLKSSESQLVERFESKLKKREEKKICSSFIEKLLNLKSEKERTCWIMAVAYGHGWYIEKTILFKYLGQAILTEKTEVKLLILYQLFLALLESIHPLEFIEIPYKNSLVHKAIDHTNLSISVIGSEIEILLNDKPPFNYLSSTHPVTFNQAAALQIYQTPILQKPKVPACVFTLFKLLMIDSSEKKISLIETLANDFFLCSTKVFNKIPFQEFIDFKEGSDSPLIRQANRYQEKIIEFIKQRFEFAVKPRQKKSFVEAIIFLTEICFIKKDFLTSHALYVFLSLESNRLIKNEMARLETYHKILFDKIENYFSSSGNFRNLREIWESLDSYEYATRARVPPLFLIQKDLIFLHNVPNVLSNQLNFNKLDQLSVLANRMIWAQRIPQPSHLRIPFSDLESYLC